MRAQETMIVYDPRDWEGEEPFELRGPDRRVVKYTGGGDQNPNTFPRKSFLIRRALTLLSVVVVVVYLWYYLS